MKSHKASRDKGLTPQETGERRAPSSISGFSLLEIVMVIGLMAILGGLGLFIAIDQYRSYALNAERATVVSLLQRARSQALNNLGESRHGIFIDNLNYTLFEGGSYATRVQGYDEIIPKSPSVTTGGIQEITFMQLNGDSSQT
ncbi:MAG TPA: hypothetical protein VI432_00510, partial [Candidatus Paceibacterota bacterium]